MLGTTTRDSMLDLLYHLQRRMGQTFNEPVRGFDGSVPEATTAAWQPVVDILEDSEAIRLVAEVPGVRPEDVQIAVEGTLLTIRGAKEQGADAKTEKVHRYERTYGAFERTFALSASIDPSTIKATYTLGVLTITLPKAETAKPHLIKVEVATSEGVAGLTPALFSD